MMKDTKSTIRLAPAIKPPAVTVDRSEAAAQRIVDQFLRHTGDEYWRAVSDAGVVRAEGESDAAYKAESAALDTIADSFKRSLTNSEALMAAAAVALECPEVH